MLWPGDTRARGDRGHARGDGRARPTSSRWRSSTSPGRPRSSCRPSCRAGCAAGRRCSGGERTPKRASLTRPGCGSSAPEVDLVGPMPYAEFQRMIDDPPGPAELLDRRLPGRAERRRDRGVRGALGADAGPVGVPVDPVPVGRAGGARLGRRTPMAQRGAAVGRASVRAVGERGRRRAAHRRGVAASRRT